MVINILTLNWTMCRQSEILESSFLNRISISNPSPQSLGIYMEEEVERLLKTRVNNSKETASSRHNRADAHMNSQKLWKYIQDLHRFKQDKILKQDKKCELDTKSHHSPSSLPLIPSGRRKLVSSDGVMLEKHISHTSEQVSCSRVVEQHK